MSPPSAPPSAMGPPPPKQSDRRATLNPSQMQDWKPRGAGDSFSLNSAPAPPPSTLHDAASDPWGAGTTWERDSPAGKAQAQRRRQTSFVPGTGAMGNKSAAGGYGAPPPVGDRRASNGATDEFHSVPSSPWGSPAKNGAPGGYYHGQNAAPAPSPPSAPPPPPGANQYRTHQSAAPVSPVKEHGYPNVRGDASKGTRHHQEDPWAARGYGNDAGYPSRDDGYVTGARGGDGYGPNRTQQQAAPPPTSPYSKPATHGGGYHSARDEMRSPVREAKPATAAPKAAPPGSHSAVAPHLKQPDSLYGGPNAHLHAAPGAAPSNAIALLGAAPEGCYLGPWRGDERARVLAYEACLQACLEGSLGTNAPQHKVDMAVHFLADRCMELRKGFGMDGILVGSRGDTKTNGSGIVSEFDGGAKPSVKSPKKFDRRKSLGLMDTGGGQRWSGVTVDVTEVSITTRGWKRFTGGVDPKDVYQAAKHGGTYRAFKTATGPAPNRGDICRVRADNGIGGSGDQCVLNVGFGDARIKLGAADEALIFDIDLGLGKVASAKSTLENLANMAGEGRNIVEMPLKYPNGKEKGYVRFTAHLEPIGGYDWGAPLTALDHQATAGANHGGDANGWAMSANGPLPPSAAYDVALSAGLRALSFHRRRLELTGPWAWLLRELSDLQGVSPNHTSLRYVRHVLAVATPTADCLAAILDHLAPCLRESGEGKLTTIEEDQLSGIRAAVEQLIGVCFQNYKNLSEDEPRGIAKQVPEQVPAPALAIALELFRILRREPLAPEAIRTLQNHLQTAARSCYRRHHSVFLGERSKNGDDADDNDDKGNARLYTGLSQLCLGLCREIGTDHVIQDAGVLPVGIRLPALASGVYCTEAAGCVSKMLTAHPPPAPPGAEAIDLVDSLCELQEAAVAADVSDQNVDEHVERRLNNWGGREHAYPGIDGAPADGELDPKALFASHVDRWIDAAREQLLRGCVAAVAKHGVGGAAMEDAYREAHQALEGFERVVMRWPDAAVALEGVLADADRLLLQKISQLADNHGTGGGYNAHKEPKYHQHHGVRESVRFSHAVTRQNAHHYDREQSNEQSNAANTMSSPKNTVAGALHRLRMGKAAAAAALRQARSAAVNARNKLESVTREVSIAGPDDGYVPPELASALTALKAMEVLRPEVCQRLVLWVSAAGGGQRAAGEEFGRKSTEVTGELRAQYAALLRRAVAGVAQAGPSLHQALRQVAAKPPGAAFKRTKREPRGGPAGAAGGYGSDAYGGGDEFETEPVDREDDRELSEEAASRDELDTCVGPILAHVDTVVKGLRRIVPQRRALVGVLRGLWDSLGAEGLKFVEEDLRQRSSWRLRLMATGAVDKISTAIVGAIRDALGHDVKEKDFEPPMPVRKLTEFIEGTASDSVSVF